MYDIQKIRTDFPILSREVYGKPLVYLDNGATTQKAPHGGRCIFRRILLGQRQRASRRIPFAAGRGTYMKLRCETVRKFVKCAQYE